MLVVEDDRTTREMYAELLVFHGALAVEAASVDDALRVLAGLAPDVLVVDLGLGGGDGRELLEAMRAHPIWSHLPCVIASGDLAASRTLPRDLTFLAKPVPLDALVQAVVSARTLRRWD